MTYPRSQLAGHLGFGFMSSFPSLAFSRLNSTASLSSGSRTEGITDVSRADLFTSLFSSAGR